MKIFVLLLLLAFFAAACTASSSPTSQYTKDHIDNSISRLNPGRRLSSKTCPDANGPCYKNKFCCTGEHL
jgi:PBP1b-binding outer membrane lipoprotein LpoB